MSHKRTGIREAAVQTLISADTPAVARVFKNRVVHFRKQTYPFINVVSLQEELLEPEDVSASDTVRTLQIAVDVYMKASADLDDELDDIAELVEVAFEDREAFGADAISAVLQSTELDLVINGEDAIGVCRLTYAVDYST